VGYLERGDTATTTTGRGQALEDLICYIFGKIPGVSVSERNETSAFNDEEIDILFWNERHSRGLYFLPCLFIAECKNWSSPVGSREVVTFTHTLRSRGCDHGILVATNGISGTNDPPTEAHHQIAMSLSDMVRIMVITRQEIEPLSDTDSLVELLKQRLCGLSRRGTLVLS
jgi:hypothetical protein